MSNSHVTKDLGKLIGIKPSKNYLNYQNDLQGVHDVIIEDLNQTFCGDSTSKKSRHMSERFVQWALGEVIVPTGYGPDPQSMTCPRCNASIVSRVDRASTTKTHLVALLLCFLFCPLFWLPYCCDSCQAANHYCPKCGAFLGTCDS